jgi:hypothetical protein
MRKAWQPAACGEVRVAGPARAVRDQAPSPATVAVETSDDYRITPHAGQRSLRIVSSTF